MRGGWHASVAPAEHSALRHTLVAISTLFAIATGGDVTVRAANVEGHHHR
jgi:hypothetical protein